MRGRFTELKEVEIDGIPVLLNSNSTGLEIEKMRGKKKGRAPKEKMEFEQMSTKARKALQRFVELGGKRKWGNMKKAGMDAGYSESCANAMMKRALDHPAARPIVEALEKEHVTPGFLARKIKEGLDANHAFRPEQPDWRAREGFTKMALELRDDFPAKKIKQEGENKSVHLHFHKTDRELWDKQRRFERELAEDAG